MSIFDKKTPVETPAPAGRTAETISRQLEDVRGRINDLASQRDSLTAEVAALVVERNPSTAYRSEKLTEELTSINFGIVEEGRLEKALSYELAQIQLPAARTEADRLAVKAEAALATLAQSIEAAIPVVMRQATAALAAMTSASVAHANADRLAGEPSYLPRFQFDQQTVAVLRPLAAFGAGLGWAEKMGRPIPLGSLFLQS